MEENNLSVSLYDMNKSIIGKKKPMQTQELLEKKQNIRNFVNKTNNKYYMLLCRELNYYTLFDKQDLLIIKDNIEDAVIECAQDYGDILNINESGEGAIEVWIRNNEDKNVYMLLFFPYDLGVVICR